MSSAEQNPKFWSGYDERFETASAQGMDFKSCSIPDFIRKAIEGK
ncbi:conserved hypothetical protein [delta proteobacterium NaphS2]|nr:conserved hypothetical protein [delta proteobacterium NaphS2]